MSPSKVLLVLGFGGLLLFLTWQARQSGEMRLHYGLLQRAESPSTFQIVLILRAAAGVALVLLAISTVLHGSLSR
jgi:hypothetical protein